MKDAIDWYNEGVDLCDQGNYADAVKAFDESIRLDSSDIDAWYNKGVALRRLGSYYNAIKAYDEAIRLDPSYAKAWNNKGAILYYLGKYEEALQAIERANEIDSKYSLVWSDKLERLQEEAHILQEDRLRRAEAQKQRIERSVSNIKNLARTELAENEQVVRGILEEKKEDFYDPLKAEKDPIYRRDLYR
jgi:tetratricopeptide (TPR) repeat protein